jgi:hypothetical protein
VQDLRLSSSGRRKPVVRLELAAGIVAVEAVLRLAAAVVAVRDQLVYHRLGPSVRIGTDSAGFAVVEFAELGLGQFACVVECRRWLALAAGLAVVAARDQRCIHRFAVGRQVAVGLAVRSLANLRIGMVVLAVVVPVRSIVEAASVEDHRIGLGGQPYRTGSVHKSSVLPPLRCLLVASPFSSFKNQILVY